MKLRGTMKKIMLTTCAALLSVGAQAATVTLVGDTMTYEYDDAQANIGLWGNISIVGDTVVFEPTTFEAESIDGTGAGLTDATFYFDRVYANNGNAISSIEVNEFGDYSIINGGDVQVDLYLQATTNPGGGNFSWAADTDSFSASGPGSSNWGLLTASLDDGDFNGPQTEMSVSIQNTLTAITYADGEVAWIEKKLAFTALAPVPLPAAAWLFGSALVGLLAVSRRRASAIAA